MTPDRMLADARRRLPPGTPVLCVQLGVLRDAGTTVGEPFLDRWCPVVLVRSASGERSRQCDALVTAKPVILEEWQERTAMRIKECLASAREAEAALAALSVLMPAEGERKQT